MRQEVVWRLTQSSVREELSRELRLPGGKSECFRRASWKRCYAIQDFRVQARPANKGGGLSTECTMCAHACNTT